VSYKEGSADDTLRVSCRRNAGPPLRALAGISCPGARPNRWPWWANPQRATPWRSSKFSMSAWETRP